MSRKRKRAKPRETPPTPSPADEAPTRRSQWRRVLGHAAVRLMIVAGVLAFIALRGDLACQPDRPTREEMLDQATKEALARAADAEAGPSPERCSVVLRRVVGDTIVRTSVLTIADLLEHAAMLELADEQIAELERRSKECVAACEQEDEETTERRRCAEHARRVLDALSVLDENQTRLVDEFLASDTLVEALSEDEPEAELPQDEAG